jgi:hypothetical protein
MRAFFVSRYTDTNSIVFQGRDFVIDDSYTAQHFLRILNSDNAEDFEKRLIDIGCSFFCVLDEHCSLLPQHYNDGAILYFFFTAGCNAEVLQRTLQGWNLSLHFQLVTPESSKWLVCAAKNGSLLALSNARIAQEKQRFQELRHNLLSLEIFENTYDYQQSLIPRAEIQRLSLKFPTSCSFLYPVDTTLADFAGE